MNWLPGWDSIASTGFWSHFWFWAGIACLFALGGAEVVSHIYGLRKDELVAAAEHAAKVQSKADADAAETRRKADVEGLQKKLSEADKKVEELEKKQAQRVLSDQQKQTLIAALAPYRGQKVVLVTMLGNSEPKRFMEDFINVFDAAGWGKRVVYGNFGNVADPVGVMLLVNKEMADKKMGPEGIVPLMDTLAAFDMVPPKTLTPSNDVGVEEIGLVVGRKP